MESASFKDHFSRQAAAYERFRPGYPPALFEWLAQARPHPRVSYRVERAERMQLADASVDLVTAAQAAHWFDLARFAAELRRVLRPGGLVALWTYEKFRAGGAVDRLVDDFYRDVVGPYWPRERRHVEERYSTLALPFTEIAVPAFELALEWDAATALDYLGTWSAVQRYRRLRGGNPLALTRSRPWNRSADSRSKPDIQRPPDRCWRIFQCDR